MPYWWPQGREGLVAPDPGGLFTLPAQAYVSSQGKTRGCEHPVLPSFSLGKADGGDPHVVSFSPVTAEPRAEGPVRGLGACRRAAGAWVLPRTRAPRSCWLLSLFKATSKQEVVYHMKLADIKGLVINLTLCFSVEKVITLRLSKDSVTAVFLEGWQEDGIFLTLQKREGTTGQ